MDLLQFERRRIVSRDIYRYEFAREVRPREIQETLHLAVLAAECLHGQSQVRLDASYCMDDENLVCVVDASTRAGKDIVRIFTGFAIKEFGEKAFKVRRVEATLGAPEPGEVPT